MDQVKAELEDMAFREQWPDAYESINHRLAHLRRDDTGLIQRIEKSLRETLEKAGIEAEIKGREKAPISIWRKMQRKNISFEQLADIMAFRVLVDDVGACYAALGCIHAAHAMLPGRFKDFISTPKPNGYRSLHTTIIGLENNKIEVQIRTREMHDVAELGVAAHWAYKQESEVTDGRRYRWIRELLDILEHATSPEDFLEHTKLEMFQDQVFCFTPRGDLISLPRGATAVDFAYAVHSEVGDHCVGAKVDGRMVQLRTKLENGDQVDIITSRNAWPSAAWERFVATGKARARIRRYLRSKQRAELVTRGRESLERAIRGSGIRLTEKKLEAAAQQLSHRSVEDMLVAVGEGNLSARLAVEQIAPRTEQSSRTDGEADGDLLPQRRGKTRANSKDDASGGLEIEGLPKGIAYQLAGCCRPVPGDSIVGVLRTGKPVSVHRDECTNVHRMKNDDSRLVDIAWKQIATDATGSARIAVTVLNRPGALGTITTVIGKQDANITDVKVGRRAKDIYEMIIEVEVVDLEQLLRTQAALRACDIVVGVERTQS